MTGVGEAAAAASVFSTARKLARELSQSQLSDRHQKIVNDLLEVITDGQERLTGLQQRIIDLQDENRALNDELRSASTWSERLEEYELAETPVGGFVYKSVGEGAEHYACPRCIESTKEIHVLQLTGKYSGQSKCPNCDNEFRTRVPPPMPNHSVIRG